MHLKIFQVTDVDWWAGYDGESVQAAYRAAVGAEADTFFQEFGAPYALTDDELDTFTVTDVDEPGQPKHSGREILAQIIESNRSIPCFVATTEY